jgi:hypothetical protein
MVSLYVKSGGLGILQDIVGGVRIYMGGVLIVLGFVGDLISLLSFCWRYFRIFMCYYLSPDLVSGRSQLLKID